MGKKSQNEIVVIGQTIQTLIENVDIFKLRYWENNPRVNAIIKQKYRDGNISESDIEKELWEKPSVKDLFQDIERHGGLIDEILVQDSTVLEGNSRLCAYRHLFRRAEQKNDEKGKIKWSHIRARIIPSETSNEVVFSILGTWHIKGKTAWDTYEKAAYLKRMNTDYEYSFKDIADSISQTEKFVKDHIEAHDLMVKNDIYTLEKFSYFYQLVLEKNKSTNSKLFEKEPEKIVSRLLKTIKDEPLKRAENLRDLPKILKDQKVRKMYLNSELDFNDAVDMAKYRHPEHKDSFYNQIKKVTRSLQFCPVKRMEEIKTDGNKQYILKQLYKEVMKLCKKVGIKK